MISEHTRIFSLLELLIALLECLNLFTGIYKSLITIITTNVAGINGMRAGDRKQEINKCWPNMRMNIIVLAQMHVLFSFS